MTADETTRNQSRMARELTALKRSLKDLRSQSDQCQMFREDLESCKVKHIYEFSISNKAGILTNKDYLYCPSCLWAVFWSSPSDMIIVMFVNISLVKIY